MIGRNKRGIRRASSMRVRLAVAAAALVGGGAAGVVALSASHSGAATAESAGFSHAAGRTMSYSGAMSSAMNGWSKSQGTSLMTISHMKPMTNSWTQSWHSHTLVLQRGTVVAVGRGEFAVQSKNGTIKVWHVTRKTRTLNVGGTSTGMSAMTGGSMQVPSWWNMNMTVKGVAKGDLVFVFGEREHHTLKAQLVLFAAPTATMPTATPTATTPMGTPTPTATTPMGTPTATTTTTAPAVRPTSTAPTFSGHNS
jgi:hypothetical protein